MRWRQGLKSLRTFVEILLLGLVVFLMVTNQQRDIQVDQVSIEERRALKAHDQTQDEERQMLQRQLNAQGMRIDQLGKEVESLRAARSR